jgi:hypothetical protein
MIISHAHKFVFVKTNKTAGSSIEVALSKYLKDGDVVSSLFPEEEKKRSQLIDGKALQFVGKELASHSSLSKILAIHPEAASYFKFGFIRNPFSRMLSSFRWRKARFLERVLHSNREVDEIQSLVFNKFRSFVLNDQGRLNERGRDLLFDAGASVDRVFALENLSKSLQELSAILAIPDLANAEIPRFKTSTIEIPGNYELWSIDLQLFVLRRFAWEFLELDYPRIPSLHAAASL